MTNQNHNQAYKEKMAAVGHILNDPSLSWEQKIERFRQTEFFKTAVYERMEKQLEPEIGYCCEDCGMNATVKARIKYRAFWNMEVRALCDICHSS